MVWRGNETNTQTNVCLPPKAGRDDSQLDINNDRSHLGTPWGPHVTTHTQALSHLGASGGGGGGGGGRGWCLTPLDGAGNNLIKRQPASALAPANSSVQPTAAQSLHAPMAGQGAPTCTCELSLPTSLTASRSRGGGGALAEAAYEKDKKGDASASGFPHLNALCMCAPSLGWKGHCLPFSLPGLPCPSSLSLPSAPGGHCTRAHRKRLEAKRERERDREGERERGGGEDREGRE